MRQNSPIHRLCFFGIAAALFGWSTLATSPALAGSIVDSFSLRISEKEMELAHTGDPAWERYNMLDLGFERMNNRNLPFLELTNHLDTPLTEFHLTIGDDRFHFANDLLGQFALLAESTPGFAIASSTASNLGDELIVTIGNGGLKKTDGPLRFQIDLDVDETYLSAPHLFFPHPDYRTVLFDIEDIAPYGPQGNEDPSDSSADNATYWVKYGTLKTEHERFPDVDIPAAPVGLYVLSGGQTIPEPTTALLAAAMIAAGALSTTRQSRKHPSDF
jgi:hypothetical protein